MKTHTLYEDVAPNPAHLSINNPTVSENALSGNYTDLPLLPSSDRWFEYYNGAITHGYIDLKKFNNKPLVVAFYSGDHRADAGLNLLRSLNAIQAEIKANGGNLLVVIPEGEPHLEQIAWLNSFTLSFYVDKEQELALHLGLYHGQSLPDYDGIQHKLSLSVFVTDAERKVIYGHVFNNKADEFYASDVISAVYASALSVNKKEFI